MADKAEISTPTARADSGARLLQDKILPNLKWIIYTLLLFNLVYYGVEDWNAAQHTLTADASLLDTMAAYAASLDFIAWIVLILIYEIETYWLEDDFDNKMIESIMQLTKVACYALILQTTYAYLVAAASFNDVTIIDGVTDLCALAGQDMSFVRNLSYTEINSDNCGIIPHSGALYLYPTEPIVTDASGLAEEAALSKNDVIENLSWLVIIVLTEFAVRLQNKGYYEGAAIVWTRRLKNAAYLAIVGASIYWVSKGHYLYAWDEFLWIAGFSALDNNLSEWRHELEEEAQQNVNEQTS